MKLTAGMFVKEFLELEMDMKVGIRAAMIMVAMSLGASAAWAQVPGAPQRQAVAIQNATIHPVSHAEVTNGTIVFADGKIVALGTDVTVASDVLRVDGTGKHVYPGLFCAGGRMGLFEIDAVRATNDYEEAGSLNPNVRAEVAVNPESEHIPVTRANGVLLTLTAPSGGLLSGTSAVLQLDGWTWEQMTLRAPIGLHVQWPRSEPVSASWIDGAGDRNTARENDWNALQKVWDEANRYRLARQAGTVEAHSDARFEAMIPVLEGKLPIIVNADTRGQIQSAVAFADQHRAKLILMGGYDAEACAPLLRDRNIPVIIPTVFRSPMRRSDPFDASYTLADRLRRAGIRFCIAGLDRWEAPNLRNLPYHAATAVAYGLPRDEALKAITLYPAEILGVADRVGSLEVGKDATLFVSDGDPLNVRTQVVEAYIQGRTVDLQNRHQRLWRKYQEKYRQLNP